jgi:hypothetical protein
MTKLSDMVEVVNRVGADSARFQPSESCPKGLALEASDSRMERIVLAKRRHGVRAVCGQG